MDQLEIFRLSAEACGKVVATGATGGSGILIHGPFVPVLIDWNPFTNAEQHWQCVEKLLEMGYCVLKQTTREHMIWPWDDGMLRGAIEFNCPASEFPARALAELKRRNP